MIKYFVSFIATGSGFPQMQTSIQNGDIVRDNPISGILDINRIQEMIAKDRGYLGVTIINWQRYE